ncbi:hypothetical protein TIFTF001_026833 [Ficus carica]|uniref:Uncharacterized protein n=1 Tax=Ficus carica TaxID=3494 RepID=A0AA88DLV8_FICCA|nr:hypothetical protein TIFTF001_026833 [Ficus carica]
MSVSSTSPRGSAMNKEGGEMSTARRAWGETDVVPTWGEVIHGVREFLTTERWTREVQLSRLLEG